MDLTSWEETVTGGFGAGKTGHHITSHHMKQFCWQSPRACPECLVLAHQGEGWRVGFTSKGDVTGCRTGWHRAAPGALPASADPCLCLTASVPARAPLLLSARRCCLPHPRPSAPGPRRHDGWLSLEPGGLRLPLPGNHLLASPGTSSRPTLTRGQQRAPIGCPRAALGSH